MIVVQTQAATAKSIEEYCLVPMAFRVESRYIPRPTSGETPSWVLVEQPIAQPYLKDYDNDEDPRDWASRFDLSNWVMISASDGAKRVGGAIIAFDTIGVDMLEGRSDLSVMWDIRVDPGYRRRGVGSTLFVEALNWSLTHGCREIKVETQDINVAACNFYQRMGCRLRSVHPGAYPTLPDEIQFLWYREL
ncbi:MAG: GNAT family N-acetyltransferase [Bacteroidota bacterium]|nr:GNAT family N-acetyltransferase [Bacteroidota bacterium]MDP4233541.1 GNAT family N-acetyltransferase [Bacteroidota bacterium]MDP4244034.1 GNAT family N-acetyltransferase [Bacteroidota bacterium]MDP4287727.1 GNAT family N-acetyltransferase [Bacteroidota bacterium]